MYISFPFFKRTNLSFLNSLIDTGSTLVKSFSLFLISSGCIWYFSRPIFILFSFGTQRRIFSFKSGYLSLIVNIPLILIAFFKLNRQFAVNSTVYVIVFSISVIFIKELNIVKHLYLTNSALASVTSSCIRGIIYAFTLELNGSAGGIDIISAIIKKKKPYLDFMNNIFAINTFIAILSFWVYDKRTEPVILSIIYSFISSKVCNNIRYRKNENIKYEIITNNPEELLNHKKIILLSIPIVSPLKVM